MYSSPPKVKEESGILRGEMCLAQNITQNGTEIILNIVT